MLGVASPSCEGSASPPERLRRGDASPASAKAARDDPSKGPGEPAEEAAREEAANNDDDDDDDDDDDGDDVAGVAARASWLRRSDSPWLPRARSASAAGVMPGRGCGYI